MIIDSNNGSLESNIPETGNSFSIAATAQAFQILSSGVYEHKIPAVVREYMTNALDSHIQAGMEDVPFRVTIPCKSHPYFEVEDFGIGMDVEAARHVYTRYFCSTKQQSNESVGGFGLGGKSFLAYTKQFTIRFRKDGTEHTALIYIDKDSIPRLDIISTVKTKESNGVKISIPVHEADFHQFEEEILFYSSFYKVTPLFNKEVVPFYDNKLFYTDDKIVFTDYKRNRTALGRGHSYVLIGPVPYPIDIRSIQGVPESVVSLFRGGGDSVTFLKMNIGDVSIAASRESLSLDADSSVMIRDRMVSHYESVCSEIDRILESGKRVSDVVRILDTRFTNIHLRTYANRKSPKVRKFNTGHVRIPNLRYLKQTGYSQNMKFQIRFLDCSYWGVLKKFSRYSDDGHQKLPILVMDKVTRRLNQLLDSAPPLVYNGELTPIRKKRIESLLGVELEPVLYSKLYEEYKNNNVRVPVEDQRPRRVTEQNQIIASGFIIEDHTITEFRDKLVRVSKENTFSYETDVEDVIQKDILRIQRFTDDRSKMVFIRENSKTLNKIRKNEIRSAESFITEFEEKNFEEFKNRNISVSFGSSTGLLLFKAGSKILPERLKHAYSRYTQIYSVASYDLSRNSCRGMTYLRKTRQYWNNLQAELNQCWNEVSMDDISVRDLCHTQYPIVMFSHHRQSFSNELTNWETHAIHYIQWADAQQEEVNDV